MRAAAISPAHDARIRRLLFLALTSGARIDLATATAGTNDADWQVRRLALLAMASPAIEKTPRAPEALAAVLRLAAERLLRDEAVRTDGAHVDLVFHHVMKLDDIDDPYRCFLVEPFPGFTVIQERMTKAGQIGLIDVLRNFFHGSTLRMFDRNIDVTLAGILDNYRGFCHKKYINELFLKVNSFHQIVSSIIGFCERILLPVIDPY